MKVTAFLAAAVLLLVSFAATAAFAANVTCPNQAVAQSPNFAGVPFEYVQSTRVNTVCPSLNNRPSCCPDAVIVAVENAFNQARAKVVAAKSEMDAIRLQSAVINREFDQMVTDINRKEANGEISAALANSLRTFVNDVRTALNNFIDRVTTSFIRCLESILTYLAGVVCFGCDSNWQNYTIIYSANNTIVVVINKATCDAMNGGCIDFYLSFVQLVVDIHNAGRRLAQSLGINVRMPTWNNPCYNGTLANDTETNGARCKTFICNRLVAGAVTGSPDAESTTKIGRAHV